MRVKRVYERVAEELKTWILEGKIKPGERFPSEDELLREFNVSRASLREAFRLLESMGLVETALGKGRFVRKALSGDITFKILRDALIARELIEPDITRYAAEKATEKDIEIIFKALCRLEDSYDSGVDDFGKCDKNFHISVAKATHNTLLLNFVLDYKNLIEDFGIRTLSVKGRKEKSLEEHRRIFDAIKRHDPDAAYEASLRHVVNVRKVIEYIFSGGMPFEKVQKSR